MTKTKDITWEHCSRVDPCNNKRVQCNYCNKVMDGGVTRMKNHIAGTKKYTSPCTMVDEHIKQVFQSLLTGFKDTKKTKARDQECFENDNDERKDGTLSSFVKKRKRKTMNQALTNRELAQSVVYDENLVGCRIKVWWSEDKIYYQGVVKSFNHKNKKHKVLYDDGVEELIDLKTEKWELVENVSPKSDCLKPLLPEKVPSPQSDTICVQGYMVKNNIATVLEAVFKKYGDIASECVFKPATVRATFLEIVCEVVMRIETSSFTTIVSEMEEIDSQVSALEGAKINVSWLRAHLEAIHKRKKAKKNSILLIETKGTTVLLKRAAQMDLKKRRAELVEAQERFVKSERCVKVLDLVEKKLSNNIMDLKAENDSWANQPII